jgi:hypothetical protein
MTEDPNFTDFDRLRMNHYLEQHFETNGDYRLKGLFGRIVIKGKFVKRHKRELQNILKCLTEACVAMEKKDD